jgi:hypothetical protein
MTPRIHALCYVACCLLLAAAQPAVCVPQRVPPAAAAPPETVAADEEPAPDDRDAATPGALPLADGGRRTTLFGPPNAVGIGERADGAPVAEPSTLLLVSCGLFGLIAWSRRRR